MRSPLSNLAEIFTQIFEASKIYSNSLQSNESSTRAVLIDPVIRALGWDTANPFMVEIEKPINQGRVDYALFDFDQEIKIIIEAKKLGADLLKQETFLSLVRYAFSAGVQDVFLTDGVNWLHFNDFQPGKNDPTRQLSLANDNLVEVAGYLVQRLDAARYWPNENNVQDLLQQVNQLKSEVSSVQLELARNKKSIISEKNNEANASTEESSLHIEEFTRLSNIASATGTKPSALLLPDSTIVRVTTWTDVLTQCCKYTMENKKSLRIPLSDAAGKKVNLFSLTAPPKGITFFETQYEGKRIFVYTNYDSNNCIRNSIHVLSLVEQSQNTVEPAVVYN
ncbi:MAG: hypothetical protein D8M60_04565 [Chloroflexi bacterium]|nr:hypothetical protein [Chloroflexota bacterium]